MQLSGGEESENFIWYTDYSMNRFGMNFPIDNADEPSRNVFFGEPNMQRAVIEVITSCIAAGTFGERPDLEENYARSLSFGFADGHAARVAVPLMGRGKVLYQHTFDQLALSAGSPPEPMGFAFVNRFWWSHRQVSSTGGYVFPAANPYTDELLPDPPTTRQ